MQAGAKRPAQKLPSATPQPKQAKQEVPKAAAPATAPPKVGAKPAAAAAPTTGKKGAAGGSDAGDYLSALKSYLASKGPTKLAVLGSAVKRPPKAPKLKHFLEQNKATFKYEQGTDTVSLAK